MVNIARTVPGVIGERMLGGGDKAAAHHFGFEFQVEGAIGARKNY